MSAVGQSSLFDLEPIAATTLVDRFVVPPFSVLDARSGYWQQRKAEWLALGIASSLGRELAVRPGDRTTVKGTGIQGAAKAKAGEVWVSPGGSESGASVFDPVTCELVYRWFAPEGGRILDPFAGGSVRGLVAAHLGRSYLGIDLSAEQVEANRRQGGPLGAEWVVGDSRNLTSIVGAQRFDLVFSCPPYYDLERYNDDPNDLANATTYESFRDAHTDIIRQAVEVLDEERFAAWVIGDVRDKRGMYRGLVVDTVNAFRAAGAELYNEAVLVTSPGSLPFRISRQFSAKRKLGRSHQWVLVFWKGSGVPPRLELDDPA